MKLYKISSMSVSPPYQADVKPEADGCNGLKYNLTADIIQSIFRTYPAGDYMSSMTGDLVRAYTYVDSFCHRRTVQGINLFKL